MISKSIYKYDRDINVIRRNNINVDDMTTENNNNNNDNNVVTFKSSNYHNEGFTKNKNYFFTLLNKIKTTYIEFKTNPTDEIEQLYNGYLSKISEFHNNDKTFYNEFKKDNLMLNKSLDNLSKSKKDKNIILEKLKKEYKNLNESGNAFGQHYNDSIYDYNYNITFIITIIGLSGVMLYLTKK
tara:strand:+ start:3078 stop:3626 length:549 start_codon:yes stop_codon:yes gene_type:complete